MFSYLALYHSEWIAEYATRFIEQDGSTRRSGYTELHGTTNREQSYNSTPENRVIKIIALILSSVYLSIALFGFHIMASLRLIQYGNEVLYDANNDEHYDLGRDDQCLPIVYTVISFLPVGSLPFIICSKCIWRPQRRHGIELQVTEQLTILGEWLQLSLGWLLVYLGFYFLPYMILAFVNDPIQTAFVYLIAASIIFCILLLTYGMLSAFISIIIRLTGNFQFEKFNGSYVRLVFAEASGMSIAYFLIILIFILTLGNFHQFQAVEHLTMPLVLGLFTLFVLKPLIKHIKRRMENDEANTVRNENIELENFAARPENA